MTRRIVTPGSYPRIFSSSDRRKRRPGSAFQKILTFQEFINTGRIGSSDRFGWPIDLLNDYLALDWHDSDGATPDTGPALTAVGTPSYGEDLYFEDQNKTQLTHTAFTAADMLRTATALDPPSGQDAIYAILSKKYSESVTSYPFSTFVGGSRGVRFFYSAALLSANVVGDASVTLTSTWTTGGWSLIVLVIDRGTATKLYRNGILDDSDVCPAGDLGASNGIGINGYPDNTLKDILDISRIMVWFGTGIADLVNDNFWKYFANAVFGLPVYGESFADYSCDCLTTDTDPGGKYYLFEGNAPRSGSSQGALFEPQITNKVYRNINPQATAGWTNTGGVFSVQNDSSDLDTAGLRELGPNVFQLANSTGVDQYVYGGATTGNTNAHSVSIFAKYVAGAGARIGLRDLSAGTFQDLGAISDSYARTAIVNQTPSDTDCQFCVKIPDGCTLMFLGQQLEEYPIATSLIPNFAVGATATRLRTIHSGLTLPGDEGGLIEIDAKSEGWSGDALQSSDFVAASTSGGKYIYIPSDNNNQPQIYDGSNKASISAAISGSYQRIVSSWGDSLRFQVDDDYSAPQWTYVDQEVFNGIAIFGYNEIDLSTAVDISTSCLAFIAVTTSGAAEYVAARKKGDTDNYHHSGTYSRGACCAEVESGEYVVMAVPTDSDGKIEVHIGAAQNLEVRLIGIVYATSASLAVHAGAMPAAWTDEDFSSETGENVSLCWTKYLKTGGGNNAIACRQNGDASNYLDPLSQGGASQGYLNLASRAQALLSITDSTGIIEHIANAAVPNATVTMESFESAGLISVGSVVFASASPPTSWTDLDLSAHTGSQKCLVALKVSRGAGGPGVLSRIAVRQNGSTLDFFPSSGTKPKACSVLGINQNISGMVIAFTDDDGIIEWMADVNTYNWEISLIGFIPESFFGYDGAMNGVGSIGIGGANTPSFRIRSFSKMRNE